MEKAKPKLTEKQEKYCQERANGKSQYDSYLIAYPKSQKWKRSSVDEVASKLERNVKIISRIAELRKPQEDLLESNRTGLIETSIKLAQGEMDEDKAKKINHAVLNKLLDKLLASKTETKSDVTYKFNISFNNIKDE